MKNGRLIFDQIDFIIMLRVIKKQITLDTSNFIKY